MSHKIEKQLATSTRPTTDSNRLGLTSNGALVILSLLKDTSDALPPLKTAVAGALALFETAKVSFRLMAIKGISFRFSIAI